MGVQELVRSAARRPGFSAAVLVTLAIGSAVTTVAASLVDRVLLRPLPYPNADRVLGVWFQSPNFPGGLTRVRQSRATFLHWRDQSEVFEAFALAEVAALTLEQDDRSTRLAAAEVTEGFLDVLGVAPLVGRAIDTRDSEPGAEPVVILAEGAWTSRFGRDESLVGRTIRVDGIARRVVGVLPDAVRFPAPDTELWIPLTIDKANLDPQSFVYTGYALLRPGATLDQARQEFDRLVALLPDAYPAVFPRPLLDRLQLSALFVPLKEELVGDVRRPLLLSLIAALAVLLAVVANVTNLFLVRNEGRQGELAIRAALGARPARLATALAFETTAYAVIGGAFGLALASGALSLLRSVAGTVIPRLHEAAIDGPLAAVSLGASAFLGLLVGALTAWRARAFSSGAPHSGARTVGSRRTARVRWALVGAQVSLAVVISTGAGLLAQSAGAIAALDPGFRAEGLTGARLFLAPRDYPEPEDVRAFYRQLVEDVRSAPGIERASAVSFLPLRDGRIFFPYQIEGRTEPGDLPSPQLTKVVFDGYFETMGIPLVEGRVFTSHDLDAGTDDIVVSQALAQAFWPNEPALGKRIRRDDGGWLTVAGVVGDVRDRSITDPGAPIVYLPFQARHLTDRRWRELSLVVRSSPGVPASARLAELVATRDRRVPVYDVRGMPEVVAAASARTSYLARLLVFCAIGALLLTGIGLYAVLSHVVAGRRREMAVRLALGAAPGQLRTLVQRQVAVAIGVGGLVGLGASIVVFGFADALLFAISPTDPLTMTFAATAVGVVGWLAALVPARRAAAVQPAATLRLLGEQT